jgi:catechol 2,3-dioxygenase-like lactoylglutathione lyase family enzyme
VPEFLRVDHVQLAIPPGREADARAFYAGVLGLVERRPPSGMLSGVWFVAGGVELHLRPEADFRPARTAHPGLSVRGLDDLAERCRTAGHEPRYDTRYPGRRRFFVDDPFGNRLELLEIERAPGVEPITEVGPTGAAPRTLAPPQGGSE